jgi:hypothetical protein
MTDGDADMDGDVYGGLGGGGDHAHATSAFSVATGTFSLILTRS